jgi:hypothetical protein
MPRDPQVQLVRFWRNAYSVEKQALAQCIGPGAHGGNEGSVAGTMIHGSRFRIHLQPKNSR